MVKEILPKLSSSRIQRHLLKLQQFGNKWPGTDGEVQTKEYIHKQMKKYGIETRLEEFEYPKWHPISYSAKIKSPEEQEIKCAPVAYYANKEAEGELVYVGSGSKPEFETLKNAGIDFNEKIVMATSDYPFAITSLVEECGAVGLITVSTAIEDLIRWCVGAFYSTTATPTLYENPMDFPAKITGAMIPMSEGRRLLSLMSVGKVRVHVASNAEYSLGKSCNIISEVKGTERPEEKVIIGAHYDTQFTTPGICDNGSGTAGLLEIARAVKKSNICPKRTMVFVWFGCEEIGCWGSVDYTKKHEKNLRKSCVGYINIDGPCNQPAMKHTLWVSDSMRSFAAETAKIIGWKLHSIEGASETIGDYGPFRDIGIPTAMFVEYPPPHPYYHTEKDSIEFAPHPKDLARTLEVSALCAIRLASTDKRF